jgi:hypothetical protein
MTRKKGRWKNNPRDDGRYLFVHSCPGSTYEDMQALAETGERISLRTFRAKIGLGAWRRLQDDLGYDRHVPISRDPFVTYHRGTYRGVPAVWLTHSRTEHIYTFDGLLGPSLGVGRNPPREIQIPLPRTFRPATSLILPLPWSEAGARE